MEAIQNNRLFIVDNSLAQDRQWLKDLFTAMAPLKKKWVSHPILDDDEILDLAAEAGAWYVYQAVFDTSDVIRNRIRRLKEYGIGVEGTIILGTDDQDEDDIKRLVDFLLEVELDVAEFTILTPFLHSPIRAQFEKQGRILCNNWRDYTADKVVFQPAKMTPEKLQELYYYAWDTFYAGGSHALKMGKLFKDVMLREMDDGTYRRYDPRDRRAFKRETTAGMSRVLCVSGNVTTEPYPVYPLGMAVIAGALARSGHEVRQFDFLAAGRARKRRCWKRCGIRARLRLPDPAQHRQRRLLLRRERLVRRPGPALVG